MADENAKRTSARTTKGKPPSHLKDFIINANQSEMLSSTQNETQFKNQLEETRNNLLENDELQNDDKISETSDDNSTSANSQSSQNKTIVNEPEIRTLMNMIQRISTQLNQLEKQREYDNVNRNDLHEDVMQKIHQLSEKQLHMQKYSQHSLLQPSDPQQDVQVNFPQSDVAKNFQQNAHLDKTNVPVNSFRHYVHQKFTQSNVADNSQQHNPQEDIPLPIDLSTSPPLNQNQQVQHKSQCNVSTEIGYTNEYITKRAVHNTNIPYSADNEFNLCVTSASCHVSSSVPVATSSFISGVAPPSLFTNNTSTYPLSTDPSTTDNALRESAQLKSTIPFNYTAPGSACNVYSSYKPVSCCEILPSKQSSHSEMNIQRGACSKNKCYATSITAPHDFQSYSHNIEQSTSQYIPVSNPLLNLSTAQHLRDCKIQTIDSIPQQMNPIFSSEKALNFRHGTERSQQTLHHESPAQCSRKYATNINNNENNFPSNENYNYFYPQQNFSSSAVKCGNPINNMEIRPNSNSQSSRRKLYDLPEFTGLPQQWPIFITAFRDSTNAFGYSNLENNLRLQKSIKGDARKAVESLLIFPDNIENVLSQLEFLYGRPECLIRCQIEEVRKVANINENRLDLIVPFSTKVQNMATFMETVNSHHHLANPILMEELVSKLPINKQLEWVQYSLSINPNPNIKDFSVWLNHTARLISKLVIPTATKEVEQGKGYSKSSKKTVLHATKNEIAENLSAEKQTTCSMCKEQHKLFKCPRFSDASIDDRWIHVKKTRLCFSCLNYGHTTFSCRHKRPCGINECKKFHNKMLHETKSPSQVVLTTTSSSSDPTGEAMINQENAAQALLSCHTDFMKEPPGILFKVVPIKLYGTTCVIDTYALLDDGSEVSIIDEDLVSQLNIRETSEQPLNLKWFGDITSTQKSKIFDIEICGVGMCCNKLKLKNVRSIKNLKLPTQSLCLDKLSSRHLYLKELPIVDYTNAHPKILIGIDNCHVGLMKQVKYGRYNEPICIRTKLGTIVYGPTEEKSDSAIKNTLLCQNESQRLQELCDTVNEYFTTENFGVKAPTVKLESEANIRARELMENTTVRINDRYETGLLWSRDNIQLPNSYMMATQRLKGLEHKMRSDPDFAREYREKIEYYVSNGYARRLTENEIDVQNPRTWYLPHFGVRNASKPGKLRIVFDAAATVNGTSLNSVLLSGPDQYQSLPKILFQFRQGKFGICGDIKEMFHQVHIRKDDQNSQRFLWRTNSSGLVDTYVMIAMTFGATCSPSTAQYVKNLNAMQFEKTNPKAVKAIIENHYVDDYVKSFNTEEEAIEITKDVTQIHKHGGFILRNFISNSKKVIEEINESNECDNLVNLNMSKEVSVDKILGMFWETSSDELTFKFNFHRIDIKVLSMERRPTKREFLSVIMSIFDPFGLLANITIHAKLIMQELWKVGVSWDNPIPDEINDKWIVWQANLKNVNLFRIPRCYSQELMSASKIEVHIFVDASESAFAAVGYFRIISNNNHAEVVFIAGKTKCAPKKLLSVPRLELQAAVLGTRLLTTIKDCHEVKIDKFYLWSDSNTVIKWIQSDHRRYKPFVAHRVAEILDNTSVSDWHWLPTKLNSADEATRARNVATINANNRWIKGPDFLKYGKSEWPNQIVSTDNEIFEEEIRPTFKHIYVIKKFDNIIEFKIFSTYTKLLRVTGWILRYLHNCKARIFNVEKRSGELNATEIRNAEIYLCKKAQYDCFNEEYTSLKNSKQIDKSSSLYQLTPYLDDNDTIRAYGRIDNAHAIQFSTRRPIILPKFHHLTKLIVSYHHELMRHTHQEAVIGSVRQKFWIPCIRMVVKRVIKECQVCKLEKAKPKPPLMGQLPEDRLKPFVRPFSYVGLDYFGPIVVTIGRRHEKRWVALFTCMTIRAIHIEIAENLSTDACLICIRNFINRRGVPIRIRSDNGTNFIGANREILATNNFLDNSRIQSELSQKQIEWVFNCPSNPHAGGCWERMVQSVKKVLHFSLKEIAPKVETLRSYLIEAENIINSRPLTHVPVTIEEDDPITPNHFLIGTSNSTQTPHPVNQKFVHRKQWRISQQLKDCFWKRWLQEYLPVLTRRSKWCEKVVPIKVDDLVIICDSDMPRNQWIRGKVQKIYEGKDGQVRMADIKTSSNVLRRPASKIAVLDVAGKSS